MFWRNAVSAASSSCLFALDAAAFVDEYRDVMILLTAEISKSSTATNQLTYRCQFCHLARIHEFFRGGIGNHSLHIFNREELDIAIDIRNMLWSSN
jgi:hypothetical protein